MKSTPPSFARVRRKLLNTLPNLAPFVVTFAHVLLSPYTKVEESFTLHAVHDVLAYGLDLGGEGGKLALWDHVTFPGAVPRSFLPPIILGLVTYPFVAAGVALGWIQTKLQVQILVRLILAAAFSHSFNHLSKTLRTRYGPAVRIWFILLSLSSFHIPYYAGRTLPNFMALPGVILSISLLLRAGTRTGPPAVSIRRTRNAIILLTSLATIVRLEIALFLLPVTLSLVLAKRATVSQVIRWGMIGGFGSLAVSAPLDYTLWKPTIPHPSLPTFTSPLQILWPELSALHYNALQGHSAEWGIMSKHYYFTNSLPKLLVGSLPLVALGLGVWALSTLGIKVAFAGREGVKVPEGVGETLRLFGLGVLGLIGAMSCIGHKASHAEWRFIIYSLPVFHLVASITAASLWSFPWTQARFRSQLRKLTKLGLLGLLALNFAVTGVMTFLSVDNYPGGEVWKVLESIPQAQDRLITIHFPSYPLQTGATLFTFLHERPRQGLTSPVTATSGASTISSPWAYPAFPPPLEPRWIYSKSESEEYSTPNGLWNSDVDYVVTGNWAEYGIIEGDDEASGSAADRRRWRLVGEVHGLDGVSRGGKYGVEIRWARKLAILGRVG
ncbi:hypothetical protein I316_05080 [Kwoniella heveanensis BCC8398]|uniref:Mannosyltransferase n=1 Tax=Kwoniella heveanensis BCC8398 TaxID=1296120 RepID=A0A1B9GQU1_9TREE|nr:hypothetical protein I316_05080 [Kwoniella heveanensis BCC8398]